ncbi:MAG: thioredoxin [Clostridiales bacterium]|nr:thioredoxin [Clostridiales bacterium]
MKRYLPAILLMVCAAALIGVGIYLRQPESVLHKAVRICMECIGLG